MKKLFKNQNVSLYKLQNDLGFNHGTLYKYANGQIDIASMPCETLLKIAHYFKIEPNELYKQMLLYKTGGDR